MSGEFLYLMHLFACGAAGLPVKAPESPLDWQKIVTLAREHLVWPSVALALARSQNTGCPHEIRDRLIRQMRSLAIEVHMKRAALLKLLGDMHRAGIPCVLLKGMAIAGLYDVPECRISMDMDVLISPEKEKEAYGFLREQGFVVNPRSPISHHALCRHPRLGLIELHVLLYDEIVENIWFGKMDGCEFVREPHEQVQTPDGSYHTLGKTDHLIFLTLHMIKHFILSGASLQQMMDIALYLKRYGDVVDMDRFQKTMEDLRYSHLICTVIKAMEQYGGLDGSFLPNESTPSEQDVCAFLNDLEVGGLMGRQGKEERRDGWFEYNRAKCVAERGKIGYIWYMVRWHRVGRRRVLLPPRKELSEKYAYVARSALLVPAAWAQRLIVGFVRLWTGKARIKIVAGEEGSKHTGRERVALFKQLKML